MAKTKKYTVHCEGSNAALSLKTKLESLSISYEFVAIEDSYEWVCNMELTDEQLIILQDPPSWDDTLMSWLKTGDGAYKTILKSFVGGTEKVSPVATDYISKFCITTIKCGSILVNNSIKSYKAAEQFLSEDENAQAAKKSIVSGSKTAYSWIKDKINK